MDMVSAIIFKRIDSKREGCVCRGAEEETEKPTVTVANESR